MKEFPKKLKVSNKTQFCKYKLERVLCYLRRDIYEHIISKEETEYYDIENFNNKYLKNMSDTAIILDKIIEERNSLGDFVPEKPENCVLKNVTIE